MTTPLLLLDGLSSDDIVFVLVWFSLFCLVFFCYCVVFGAVLNC